MSDPQLPHIRAAAVGPGGQLTPEFYTALSQTITSLRQQITTVAAVVDAITDGTGNLQSLGTLLASKQDASEDLDAIAEIVGGGLVSRSALGDWNTRVLQEPGAGLTIDNADGRDGDPSFTLADDLAAVEGLATTGVAVRTAASTWATRTLTGTTDRITVTNGDGVAGAPTFDIAATYAGQASITTLGTVATGTWNATAISLAKGGTGQDYSTRVANTVWSGPASGADAAPTFRALVKADLQAVVADALVDGVTDVAPSQNVVVDALALKANDSEVLKKTGSQSFSGVKISSDVIVTPTIVISTTGTTSYQPGCFYSDANWGMLIRANTAAPSVAHFALFDGSGAGLWQVSLTKALVPAADNDRTLGTAALRMSATYSRLVYIGAGTAFITSGTGTPESVIVAPVGSIYTRTDGGSGTTLYIKESGAGSTGWVAK